MLLFCFTKSHQSLVATLASLPILSLIDRSHFGSEAFLASSFALILANRASNLGNPFKNLTSVDGREVTGVLKLINYNWLQHNCFAFYERRVIRDEALSNYEMSFLLGNEEGNQLDICSLLAGYQSHRRSVG